MTDALKPYAVIMRDNFDYMDDDETYEQGRYATYEEALRVCKEIVEASLRHHRKPGMNAQELYEQYVAFGDDPSIVGPDAAPFSAWGYALARAASL